jgi:hypothetical protein
VSLRCSWNLPEYSRSRAPTIWLPFEVLGKSNGNGCQTVFKPFETGFKWYLWWKKGVIHYCKTNELANPYHSPMMRVLEALP